MEVGCVFVRLGVGFLKNKYYSSNSLLHAQNRYLPKKKMLAQWVLEHVNKEASDWKVTVLKHNVRVSQLRVFLRHHSFREHPIKTSCHEYEEKRFYSTLLPYHPTAQLHTHVEKVVYQFDTKLQNNHVKMDGVNLCTDCDMTCLSKSCIEYGSLFSRPDMEVLLTLVEKRHEENYGQIVQNKPVTTLYIHTTWNSNHSSAQIRRKLDHLQQVLNWFDF